MLRYLSMGLLASAVAIASLPLKEDDGGDEALGDVFSISLMEMVKPTNLEKKHEDSISHSAIGFHVAAVDTLMKLCSKGFYAIWKRHSVSDDLLP